MSCFHLRRLIALPKEDNRNSRRCQIRQNTDCVGGDNTYHYGYKTFPSLMSLWYTTTCFFIYLIFMKSTIVLCDDDKMEIKYPLYEEEKQDKIIGDVKQDSGILNRLNSPNAIKQLRFQFLSKPRIALAIDEITGLLRVNGRVDRDYICPSQPTCEIKLNIATKPVEFFEIIKVTIDLLDRNDNSPEFNQAEITHRILESSMPGTTLMLPVAKDLDSPDYGIERYDLLSLDDTNTFTLKKSTKIDGSTELKLVLNSRLNREGRDRYQLRVTAYDGGETRRSGNMDVFVEVEDTNDNPPIFQNSTYHIHVPETLPIGSSILKVKAMDIDLGLNGEVEYSFSSYTKQAYGTLFSIDPQSGVIKLRKGLDYEKVQLYTLTVTARDKGPDSIQNEATVVISVLDENDHAPEMTINTLTKSGTNRASVVENTAKGTFVAHINVVDRDSGNNGRVNCTLPDNNFKLFQLFPTEYKIVTATELDRELKPEYSLSVMCKDSGSRPQTTVKQIIVTVEDINDNEPVFSHQTYTTTMLENNYEGYSIIQVNATDADTGRNGQIMYNLPKDISSYLSINSTTGQITAKSRLDNEEMQEVSFYVTAKDMGTPSKTATCRVTIDIEDVNDEAPQFSQKMYSVGVPENKRAGFSMGKLPAKDADEPPNNVFSFSLTASNHKDLEKFEINEKTGELSTKRLLDREEKAVYMLTAIAHDDRNPSLRSLATINIYVGDSNDNKPEWKFPTKLNNTIYISNRVPNGHQLARLRAEDRDNDNNVKYHITKGNEDGQFNLDPTTGILSVNAALDGIDYHTFELEVIAQDSGKSPNRASSQLNIVVNKTIVFPFQQTAPNHLLTGTNFTIVVSLTCACLLLSVILITVIIFIRRKERKKRIRKYNCRMEALKMLTAKDPQSNNPIICPHSPIIMPHHNSTPPHICYDDRYVEHQTKTALMMDEKKNNINNYSDRNLNNANSTSSNHSNTWSNSEKHKVKFASPPDRYMSLNRSKASGGRHLDKREVEVHRFLDSLGEGEDGGGDSGVGDRDSIHSGDGSNTDSGRGPSEEGEAAARHLADAQRGMPRGILSNSRQHSATLPIHPRSHGQHLTDPNQQQHRFQTFSPPSLQQNQQHQLDNGGSGSSTSVDPPYNSFKTNQTSNAKESDNSLHNNRSETTYVPPGYTEPIYRTVPRSMNNSNFVTHTPADTLPYCNPHSTETTFDSSDNTETNYVPHTVSTLSNCRTRFNHKYFPVNTNVKDTTL